MKKLNTENTIKNQQKSLIINIENRVKKYDKDINEKLFLDKRADKLSNKICIEPNDQIGNEK